MAKPTITFDSTYLEIPINNNKELGAYKEILDNIYSLMTYMKNKHSKVFFMRFDLRFPHWYSSPYLKNHEVKSFMANYSRILRRKGLDPKYLWVREQDTNHIHHYHVFFLFNGNMTQSIYGHLKEAERIWKNTIGLDEGKGIGLVDYCNRERPNGIMIKRNDNQAFFSAFEWASYLAKIRTKGFSPYNTREFGNSQLN